MATYIGRGVIQPTSNNEDIKRLTAELDEVKKANAELTAQVETLSAEKESISASYEELSNANAELTAQVEKLSKKDK